MNSLRHIIVEGPDGSGKDTLIGDLLRAFPDHTLHERASTSLGGPVANLAQWVARDVSTMAEQPPSIYNRHPLISELIYSQYRTDPAKRGFSSAEWSHLAWRNAMRKAASEHAIVVFCNPPYRVLRKTIVDQGPDAHMPGVFDNILDIYVDYRQHMWPGINIRYDYTTENALPELLHKINLAFTKGRP